MSIIFRVDDFPGVKPEEFWKHNLDNLRSFDKIMEDNGVPQYFLGVIPKYTTPEHLEYLKDHPRIKVSMHGIDHDETHLNEFRPWQTQKDVTDDLEWAKSLWQSKIGLVDSYIPPHNVIDHRTVRALISAGFKTLFCGPGTDGSVRFDAEIIGLNVLHSEEFLEYGRSDELLSRGVCIPWLRPFLDTQEKKVLTLHFTWEINIGLQHLDRFLKELLLKCHT
jgi:hypothetical protein